MRISFLKTQSLKIVLPCLLLLFPVFTSASESAAAVSVSTTVAEINKYGSAVLEMDSDDFNRAGFALGDIVTVTSGSWSEDMPYLNGYYVDRDQYVLVAYPGEDNITASINYGSFSAASGIAAGAPVTVTLKEPAGALELQEINDLVYSDDRADSGSDAEFANFRAVVEGKLYRSASPVDNKRNRAPFADECIRSANVQTVMNMSDTAEEIRAFFEDADYSSPYYYDLFEDGKVIALGMDIDYTSDEFASNIVKGFSFLAEQNVPFLIHCLEGKDRTGFAAMLLEALIGWDEEQIVADYMLTYSNYYGIEPGTKKYNMIAEKNVKEMLCFIAGTEIDASLDGFDLQAAAEDYLVSHGMEKEAVKTLREKLF